MNKKGLFSLILLVGFLVGGVFSTSAVAKDITIGFTGPLSGPAAQYGRDCVAGLSLAIKDLNKAGGIKIGKDSYTFKLVTYDDLISPTDAVNNARRLVSREGAKVVFNPVFNTLAPLMQINEERGSEFLVMAYTSTPAVDQIKNRLAISIPPPFSAYAQAFAERAWEKGYRKCSMVVTLGAYGDEWRKEFRKVWTAKGGEIVADQPANYYKETDFSSFLTAALAPKPDFMLIGGPSDPTGLVIEQARNLGFTGSFVLVDQAKMNYIVDVTFKGDIAKVNNVMGVARTLDIGPHAMMKPLIERFAKEENVKVATSENVLHYSAMRMLAAAMQKAQSKDDPAKIKASFRQILPMPIEQNPIMYIGLQETKLLVPGTIQVIENNQYQTPVQYVWWTKSEQEFQKIVKMMPERNVISKNLPLEGYAF